MKYQGQDLISKETIFTGRTILTIGLGRLIAWCIDQDIEHLTFLGVEIQPEKVDAALLWVLGLLCVAHLVHWWSDHVSRWTWNSPEREAVSTIGGTGSQISKLSAAAMALNEVSDSLRSKLSSGTYKEAVEQANRSLERLNERVAQINMKMETFNRTAKFQLYGWHLALPLLVVFVASLVSLGVFD